ncbi:SIR2 family protein [Tsukamurella tyrosinosolvens]|uniref:SIR2 family protein n=1 Tax=Tsukamurella tyrosinosolvens TaxID=57704 RepID=UPI002DD450B0|nr:SIR2 family protein [Tsukamurella tyrosinosolvens]MEC4613813.1 SIR2 family protein [Tsukamurella tyrosinosolvens]
MTLRVLIPGTATWEDVSDTEEDRPSNLFRASGVAAYGTENLVVLLGLGTSLGLKNSSGAEAPSMWHLLERAKRIDGFDEAEALVPAGQNRDDIELLLSVCQMHTELTSNSNIEEFLRKAESEVLAACRFVDATTDLSSHEALLRKIGRRSTRLSRAQIFTTNYDLAVERAARNTRFTLLDGFGPATGEVFDGGNFDLDVVRRLPNDPLQLAPNVVQLYKLHGSVDWTEDDDGVRRSESPANPVLIYPSSMKYQQSYRPPYLESMARFQMTLRRPDTTLIVAGFGFNDAHLTAPIMSAIQSNVSLRLIVVDPAVGKDDDAHVVRTSLRRLVESGDNRILLVAGKFGEFVSALPDVNPPDIRDVHNDRFRASQTGEP